MAEQKGEEEQDHDLADTGWRDVRALRLQEQARRGVRNTPSKLEKAAAATAPATLPPAIDV
jgi:hypothetical protein